MSGTAGEDRGPLPFLTGCVPPSFERRVVTIAPGQERPFDGSEWRDALVTVTSGQVEMELLNGRRQCFRAGAVLWLDGVAVRVLRSRGTEPAVLVAVSRRAPVGEADAEPCGTVGGQPYSMDGDTIRRDTPDGREGATGDGRSRNH